METEIKRFAAICEKYYTAAVETGGVQQGDFQMIGEMFADYSATITTLELRVLISDNQKIRGRYIQFREKIISIPMDTTDAEFRKACGGLESSLHRVTAVWSRNMGKPNADSVARLRETIKKAEAEIQSILGA